MFSIKSYTGGFAMTNGYILSFESGANLLIDAPDGISTVLEDAKINVTALLLTHLHYDHSIDAAAVKESQNCPIYSFSELSEDLTLESLGRLPISVPKFDVDHLLEGESSLTIDDCCNFELLHVPGHSPDSVCFRPNAPSKEHEKVLFGGDVLFRGGIGRSDFPHGDEKALLSGIRDKLYALPEETVVFPGHGPETTIGDEKTGNPFVRG